jgi:hypothetical protein
VESGERGRDWRRGLDAMEPAAAGASRPHGTADRWASRRRRRWRERMEVDCADQARPNRRARRFLTRRGLRFRIGNRGGQGDGGPWAGLIGGWVARY